MFAIWGIDRNGLAGGDHRTPDSSQVAAATAAISASQTPTAAAQPGGPGRRGRGGAVQGAGAGGGGGRAGVGVAEGDGGERGGRGPQLAALADEGRGEDWAGPGGPSGPNGYGPTVYRVPT